MAKDEGQREYELVQRLREATDRRWGGGGQRGQVVAMLGPATSHDGAIYQVEDGADGYTASRNVPHRGHLTHTEKSYDDPVDAYRAIRGEEDDDEC